MLALLWLLDNNLGMGVVCVFVGQWWWRGGQERIDWAKQTCSMSSSSVCWIEWAMGVDRDRQ